MFEGLSATLRALTAGEATCVSKLRSLPIERQVGAMIPVREPSFEELNAVEPRRAPAPGTWNQGPAGHTHSAPRASHEQSAWPTTAGTAATRATPEIRDYDFFTELDQKLAELDHKGL
jgi:hypothetical protein